RGDVVVGRTRIGAAARARAAAPAACGQNASGHDGGQDDSEGGAQRRPGHGSTQSRHPPTSHPPQGVNFRGRSTVTIAAVSLETELQELMTRVAETDQELAQRLADAVRYDPDAEVDGVTKGVLTTVDLLRIRGRLDALREAVLRLARELDARS